MGDMRASGSDPEDPQRSVVRPLYSSCGTRCAAEVVGTVPRTAVSKCNKALAQKQLDSLTSSAGRAGGMIIPRGPCSFAVKPKPAVIRVIANIVLG
jgi:hypothetical protein